MGNKITRRCSSVDERYTRLQGLYPQGDVDQKKLRRLILESKLAPCFPGEDEFNAEFEECPICFLCYPSLNRSKCCSKGVCTECYIQIKSPRAARATQCPFCKAHNYAVEFRGGKSQEEKTIEAAEEQKVIEAKIRMRKQELLDDEKREQRQKENSQESSPDMPRTPPVDDELVETPQQESVASGLSADGASSCDDLDASGVHEDESGSEGSLAPTPAPQQSVASLLLPRCQPMASATSQHQQPRPAPPGYTRHRDNEFDFDLEDIMVMEAIWQSIQEQGTCAHRYTASEPVQMTSTQLSASISELGVDAADRASRSQAQSPPTGSQARDQQQHPRGTVTGGLATAIAALAERHAATTTTITKGEATASEFLQISNRALQASQQAEVGTSSCAHPNDLSCAVASTNSPAVVGRVAAQTFEEQMMLAMALSINDAQSRARLEDSHPRPLPHVS